MSILRNAHVAVLNLGVEGHIQAAEPGPGRARAGSRGKSSFFLKSDICCKILHLDDKELIFSCRYICFSNMFFVLFHVPALGKRVDRG